MRGLTGLLEDIIKDYLTEVLPCKVVDVVLKDDTANVTIEESGKKRVVTLDRSDVDMLFVSEVHYN